MSDNGSDSRACGIGFRSLDEELGEELFPIDNRELLSRYGDHELELADGTTTLAEVLEPAGGREYEAVGSVRRAVLTMVDDDAVGPEGYTDRGGSVPGSDATDDPDSL